MKNKKIIFGGLLILIILFIFLVVNIYQSVINPKYISCNTDSDCKLTVSCCSSVCVSDAKDYFKHRGPCMAECIVTPQPQGSCRCSQNKCQHI